MRKIPHKGRKVKDKVRKIPHKVVEAHRLALKIQSSLMEGSEKWRI